MELPEFEEEMRTIARNLEADLQERFGRIGFALIVFDFGAPGIGNYISNAKREDMIKSLQETVDRLNRGEDIPAAHPVKQ